MRCMVNLLYFFKPYIFYFIFFIGPFFGVCSVGADKTGVVKFIAYMIENKLELFGQHPTENFDKVGNFLEWLALVKKDCKLLFDDIDNFTSRIAVDAHISPARVPDVKAKFISLFSDMKVENKLIMFNLLKDIVPEEYKDKAETCTDNSRLTADKLDPVESENKACCNYSQKINR